MRAAGIKTPVPLEELEGHLREEIDRQMKAGTDSKQAFEAAVQKIGPASALESEFKKVDAARKERDRALYQKVLFILTNLSALLGCSLVLFKRESISQMSSGQRISCLAAAATLALFIWIGRLGGRFFPVIRSNRTGAVIAVLVAVPVVLWPFVFSYLILPRYDFTLGPLLVAIYWALSTPIGVLGGLVMGIGTAARKKGTMAVS